MNKETTKAIAKLVANWDKVKQKQVLKKEDYGSERETVIGKLWWDNPDLIFVLVTDQEEGYDSSQAQIGITRDGKIRWEYQSHCSCNSYEDSTGEQEDFLSELTKKSYELNGIPLDWEKQIVDNIKKLCTK